MCDGSWGTDRLADEGVGAGVEVGEVAGRTDGAVGEHDHVIGETSQLIGVVAHPDHRDAGVGEHPPEILDRPASRPIERSLLWASLRALVQLLLVGWVLQFVVDPDDPLIFSVIWLLAMIGFAAYTTSRRAADVPKVLPLSMIAYTASAVVVLGVLFGFGIYELEGRTLVPLAGMVVGNSLAATVLVDRKSVV